MVAMVADGSVGSGSDCNIFAISRVSECILAGLARYGISP